MAILRSIATALPPNELSQEISVQMAKSYCVANPTQFKVLERLHKMAAIDTRRIVFDTTNLRIDDHEFFKPIQPSTGDRMLRYKQEIVPLATSAAKQALTEALIKPIAIGNLVTVSCTGFAAPGMDIALIKGLALPADVTRTHIGFMGCHGALNGLRAAAALTETSGKPTLLVAAELCSLHFQYGNKRDHLLANALFADGAAAVVLLPDNEHTGLYSLKASASYLLPDSESAMTWEIGDHGYTMTLGSEVPGLIEANLKAWLVTWLGRFDLGLEDIKGWAVHPGGPRILDAVQQALSLTPEALTLSREILARYGNMSSPTVLFILQKLARAEGKNIVDRPADKTAASPVVVMAFGPGLTIECALLV